MTKPKSAYTSTPKRTVRYPAVSEFMGGHYTPHPTPAHYCAECDFGFGSVATLHTHRWLKHNGDAPTFARSEI